ncbi:MAG: hypothetical protein ACLFNU_07765 [Bacteroidales bacterium]
MKRVIILFSILFLVAICAQAQVNPRTIGVRLGGGSAGNGGEISYQHGLGDANRLEIGAGLNVGDNVNALGFAAAYHWVKNIDGGFNWYIGPGAAFSMFQASNADDYIGLSVGGQIGLEYDFTSEDVPFLISIDTRPMWGFLSDDKGFGWGAALGIRYVW